MGDLAETFRSPKELLSRLVLCGEAGGEREARGARRCASGEAGPSAGESCRAATVRGESRGEGPRDAGFPVPSRPEPWRGLEPPVTPASAPLSARRSGAPWGRTERWVLSRAGGQSTRRRPGQRAHWSGCVCSAASNFSPIPLVSHRGASDRAPGSPRCRLPVGRATGERSGRGPGRAEQGQRPRSRAEPPRAEEACPGREPPLGPENVGRGRDREGDLEEGPASDVRSPPGSFS